MSNSRYSDDALMDIFQTTGASHQAIWKWKGKWRDSRSRVAVDNFTEAMKILIENNIDPLYYQIRSEVTGDQFSGGGVDTRYIVFYREEHEIFFKLHYGIT